MECVGGSLLILLFVVFLFVVCVLVVCLLVACLLLFIKCSLICNFLGVSNWRYSAKFGTSSIILLPEVIFRAN